MAEPPFPDIDAAFAELWQRLDGMPLTERAEGAARLRSFLERRGIALGSDEEDVLTGWSRGDVTGEYFSKTISPLVGYVTRRGVTE